MAAIGARHIGADITLALISHCDKFRALEDISEHPTICDQVRSLFYMRDRLNIDSLGLEEAWVDSDIIPKRPAYELGSLDAFFQRCRRLREVTVASEDGCTRHSNAFRTANL